MCLCQQAKRKKKEEAANAKILEAEKRIKVWFCCFFLEIDAVIDLLNYLLRAVYLNI